MTLLAPKRIRNILPATATVSFGPSLLANKKDLFFMTFLFVALTTKIKLKRHENAVILLFRPDIVIVIVIVVVAVVLLLLLLPSHAVKFPNKSKYYVALL